MSDLTQQKLPISKAPRQCHALRRNAPDGKIELDVAANDEIWEVRLHDYGKKCNPSQLKGRELSDIRPGGLGLFFIQKAFDEVHFDHSQEKGTYLVLRKKKSTKGAPEKL